MIRTPLRPLARILKARDQGQNPDAIEAENIRLRHEDDRDRARLRAEGRLLVMGVAFFCAFLVVGARMGTLAGSVPEEPTAQASGSPIIGQRADIVDRNGRVLATNLDTHSLYAQIPDMVDPARAARELAGIFPELEEEELLEDFTGSRRFLWIRREISSEQMQAVHDIGDPGLLFGPREMRLYPNGSVAAHILGGATYGREGVNSAEVIGVAGVEKFFDDFLRDPANEGAPLELSIDLTVQAASERVLHGGMMLMAAKGASSVLMDVHTGEIISMVSLPDFDPNDRPRVLTAADGAGDQSDTDVIVKSSNIGTARIALMIGAVRQRAFLGSLGFLEHTPVEMVEAPTGDPLLPANWSEISTMTISYGYGLSSSPVHLATAYSSVLNGGYRVEPTLERQDGPQYGDRVVSEEVSATARSMLRAVVDRGTASFGDVEGYEVGGKTGTADKPRPTGGYYDDRTIATFASVCPANDPKYVLIVTLDEPSVEALGEQRRTAGWTAVPVAAEMIRRVAPLLGMRPDVETLTPTGVTLTSN